MYLPKQERIPANEIAAMLAYRLTDLGPDAYGVATWQGGNAKVRHSNYVGRADSPAGICTILSTVPRHARWVIGHTRYATHGDPEHAYNNHPIRHGRIIGAHNGVIWNYADILRVTGRHDRRAEVDSEAIFALAHKFGADNVEELSELCGSIAATYVDIRRPSTLYLLRGADSPLIVGRTENGGLIWASERQALHSLRPLVTYVETVDMPEDRLYVVRDGRIVQRLDVPFWHPRPVVPAKKKGGKSKGATTPGAQHKASKRGEIIFGK